jgi:ATP-dependent 26S proteasome regulatory subunit
MTVTDIRTVESTWTDANRAYLRLAIDRVGLLFKRRVRWLRQTWDHDPIAHSHVPVISDALADRLLQGDDRQAEQRFYAEDPECMGIGRRIGDIDEALAGERQRLADSGSLPALEILARLFGLGSLDRDILLLCLAADEEAGFATLCAYAQDDVQARYPTLSLAVALFCTHRDEEDAARAALLPAAPLRRFQLVGFADSTPGTAQGMRPLHIDSRIADYARGFNRLDERLVPLLRATSAAPLVGRHRDLVDGLVRWAASPREGEPWPAFNLTGARGAGKRAIAHDFCARLGLTLHSLDARRLAAIDPDRQQALQVLIEREAVLSRTAIYVDLSEVDGADRATLASMHDWIEGVSAPLFVGSREPWRFDRHAMHVAIPKLDLAARHTLWNAALEAAGAVMDEPVEQIVQQFDLGPEAIPEVVHIARAHARRCEPGDEAPFSTHVWRACREHVGWAANELAQRLEPAYTFDDIVLPDDALLQLQEIATQVQVRSQVYERWGFGPRLTRGRGISALFAGPSGTGKTMAAETLARRLQLDLYRIDLAGVVSKYIGETEKNLRSVFDAAEQTGAILLFDEADALFGKRSEVKDSHDRYANIEVNYLLQRMEDYRGLAILCTNRRSALDRAFMRRLRFLIDFPFPDADHRRRIWLRVFPPEAAVDSIDWNALSRLEIAGGNIRNIAVNAAFLAAGQHTSIRMEHVLHAARREYTKIDKLPTEAEFGGHTRQVTV